MKKCLLLILAFMTIGACSSVASNNSAKTYQTNNTLVQNNCGNNYYNGYRPYSYGPIVSTGTNYISRDKATGEIKQVVQVGPPRPSYGAYYY